MNIKIRLLIAAILLVTYSLPVAAYKSSCKADDAGWYDVDGVRHLWPDDLDVSGFFDGDYYVFKSIGYVFVKVEGEVRVGERAGQLTLFQYDSSALQTFSYIVASVSDSDVTYRLDSTSVSRYYLTYGSASDDISLTRSTFLESDLLYSTVDFFDYDDPDSLFFHPTEPPILATAVAPVRMDLVLQEVLKMTPIGLACLAGFAALRKGLALLRRILYQA